MARGKKGGILILRFASLAVALLIGFAPSAEAKKKYKHPLGFRVELPDGWTAEESPAGATLHPPGVRIDAAREDNPEVYSLWVAEQDDFTEEAYVKSLRERFKTSKIEVDRGGDVEAFSSSGRPGVIYTFDFKHPERKGNYRIRVYAVQHKRKPLLLIATGQREKLNARDNALREIARSVNWM